MSVALPILGPHEPQQPPAAPIEARRPGRLLDSHGRAIRDLRLSVTDRCNYRCVYCMDPDFRYMPKTQLLGLEEYLAVARVCVGMGIEKIRITGGEPTLYAHLDDLIDGLGRLGLQDLALTTNGSLLDRHALTRWRASGLKRITMSLDSLRPERAARITRAGASAERIVRAIDLARETGFETIKVNMVVMRGVNHGEIVDFADFARRHAIEMRFIEFMPLDSSRAWRRQDVFGADEILEALRGCHDLVPVERNDPSSTAIRFAFADGAPGSIGIIAPVTRPFCGACSRLRVTADGKVRPCLFSAEEWDLRPLLRRGAGDDAVAGFIVDSMWTKQAGHGIGTPAFAPASRTMSAIGG
jgi:cyclic pyranopterin phosphate synthase